jgi:hypothetical protein
MAFTHFGSNCPSRVNILQLQNNQNLACTSHGPHTWIILVRRRICGTIALTTTFLPISVNYTDNLLHFYL